MPTPKKLLPLFALMLALTAVSAAAKPLYKIPPGSVVVLNQRLEIPPNTTHVNLQSGKVTPAVSRFYPRCKFTVTKLSNEPQYLEPGTFSIESFNTYQRPWGLSTLESPIRVASLGIAQLFDRTREINYTTDMKLASPEQPNIRRMICLVTDDGLGNFLSLEDIQGALGSYAALRLGSR